MSHTNRDDRLSLKIVRDRLDDQTLPPPVRASFEEHYKNLENLSEGLKKMGMNDAQIDGHVIEIFKEYEHELAANISRIHDAEQAKISKI